MKKRRKIFAWSLALGIVSLIPISVIVSCTNNNNNDANNDNSNTSDKKEPIIDNSTNYHDINFDEFKNNTGNTNKNSVNSDGYYDVVLATKINSITTNLAELSNQELNNNLKTIYPDLNVTIQNGSEANGSLKLLLVGKVNLENKEYEIPSNTFININGYIKLDLTKTNFSISNQYNYEFINNYYFSHYLTSQIIQTFDISQLLSLINNNLNFNYTNTSTMNLFSLISSGIISNLNFFNSIKIKDNYLTANLKAELVYKTYDISSNSWVEKSKTNLTFNNLQISIPSQQDAIRYWYDMQNTTINLTNQNNSASYYVYRQDELGANTIGSSLINAFFNEVTYKNSSFNVNKFISTYFSAYENKKLRWSFNNSNDLIANDENGTLTINGASLFYDANSVLTVNDSQFTFIFTGFRKFNDFWSTNTLNKNIISILPSNNNKKVTYVNYVWKNLTAYDKNIDIFLNDSSSDSFNLNISNLSTNILPNYTSTLSTSYNIFNGSNTSVLTSNISAIFMFDQLVYENNGSNDIWTNLIENGVFKDSKLNSYIAFKQIYVTLNKTKNITIEKQNSISSSSKNIFISIPLTFNFELYDNKIITASGIEKISLKI